MKRNNVFLAAILLIASFCKSQTASIVITKNYIAQSVIDRSVMTMEVKQNHKYVLKTFDSDRKLRKKIKGKWTLEGDKLVLKEKSGKITVLEKYNGAWYDDPNEFCARFMRRLEGC